MVDLRGAVLDELKYRFRFSKNFIEKISIKIQILLYKNINKFYSKKQNGVFSAVSHQLKEYFKNNGYKNVIYVNPNISSENFSFNLNFRTQIRDELNIKNEQLLVVISTSGNEIWQKDKDVVEYFSDSKKYVILNLSKSIISQGNVINMFVQHDKVPYYLSPADIGIVWRDSHILNYCASPSKFSEFATMGLFIIHNNTVGLISDYIKSNINSGILIGDIKDIKFNKFEVMDIENREKRALIGLQNFGINIISNSYLNIYLSMNR